MQITIRQETNREESVNGNLIQEATKQLFSYVGIKNIPSKTISYSELLAAKRFQANYGITLLDDIISGPVTLKDTQLVENIAERYEAECRYNKKTSQSNDINHTDNVDVWISVIEDVLSYYEKKPIGVSNNDLS